MKKQLLAVAVVLAATLGATMAWAAAGNVYVPGMSCAMVQSNWTRVSSPQIYGAHLINSSTTTLYAVCDLPTDSAAPYTSITVHGNYYTMGSGSSPCLLFYANEAGWQTYISGTVSCSQAMGKCTTTFPSPPAYNLFAVDCAMGKDGRIFGVQGNHN